MPFTLHYSLQNAGWATITLTNETHSATLSASSLHDSLNDFISAANLLLQGTPEAKVFMMEEPGEHLMWLLADQHGNLDIEVRTFSGRASWDRETEKEYGITFKAKGTVKGFAEEVVENVERILSEEGMEGYREKWRREFPRKGWERLRGLIK